MDAKELRIGNLVNTPMGEFKIRGIDLDENNFKDNCFDPIPLTEEWLLKMGFEKTRFGFWSNKIIIRNSVIDTFRFRASDSIGHIDVNHVHTLQNLYFALVEEELTLKDV